jgi:hypothetical protein
MNPSKLLLAILSALFVSPAFANQIQSCKPVDDFDDWSLTFDFAAGYVRWWDNDSEYFAPYSHTVETVGGVDVFSNNSKSPGRQWSAEFYGNREGQKQKAVLNLPTGPVEFVCSPQTGSVNPPARLDNQGKARR